MAEGEEVGGVEVGGRSTASGRCKEGGIGRDEWETGTIPSGVDWREPLEPKWYW